MTLDKRAIDLRVQAVKLLGAQAADALAQMKDASQKVDDFLAGVKKIEGQLVLASAVVVPGQRGAGGRRGRHPDRRRQRALGAQVGEGLKA